MTNESDPQEHELTSADAHDAGAPDTSSAPVETPTQASAPGDEPVSTPEAASASAESASSDDASSESAADGDTSDEGASADDASGEGDGEDGAKKKRRRRRKKKGAAAAAPLDPAKAAQVPFLRYFEAGGAKRHAFAVGEIVAGRVERVGNGVAVIDLFGKASAVMDELEPLEISDLPEAPAHHPETAADDLESAEAVDAPADEAIDEEAAATEASAEESAAAEAPAEEPALEAPAAEAPAAEAPAEEAAAAEAPAEEAAAEAAPATLPISQQPKADAPPAIGSIFRGRVGAVAESGHIALMNRAVDRAVAKAAIRDVQERRERIDGLVYGFNRGGFDVLVEGIRAFCPASGMALGPVEDPSEYLGRMLEFTVPPSKGGKSIVVSRRGVLEKELRKAARERLKNLEVGAVFDGVITQVREYGLLVDIGEGLEGLVHQSEVSWTRGARPGDVGKPGDQVKVKVLRVQPISRKERHGRVSLSLRACQDDPWIEHKAIIREGHAQKAVVVRTTEFGAFMRLTDGIEGLLHISELGGKDLTHARQAVEEGDELAVIVERVDREQRRISLSLLSPSDAEKLEAGEFEPTSVARPPKQGAHVTVVIERVEHHGILAQVEGVAGRRGRAYIPNRELADDGGDRRKAFGAGAKLEVKVVAIDRDGQIRCSIRALRQDEERRAVKDYRREAARQGFGTFGDLLRQKLGDNQE